MRGPGSKIVVVGAGAVGLAAALALEGVGYRVTLIGPPRRQADERTSALLGGSVGFLKRIGVWAGVESAAAPLRTLRIVDATDRLIRAPEVTFESRELGLDAFGYNIPNESLLTALETAVARRDIARLDMTVEHAVSTDDSVRLKLSSGAPATAPLVVAADGRKSVMRASVGITINAWNYDQAALVVNLSHSRSHDDTSTEFHTPTGPFTLVPLPGRRSSLVWVGSGQAVAAHDALSDRELARTIENQSASILGAIEIDGKRQVFPLAGMNAHCFAAKRVVLVGEAAHIFPPIGAQGLNLGYRDVAALTRLLTGPLADPGAGAVLARFDAARRSDILSRTAAVDALNRTLLSDFIPIQGLRGLGLFLLDRVSPLRRVVMRLGLAAE